MAGGQSGWSWERYRHATDTSSDVVCETDAEGRLVWLQPTVASLLGWEAAELLGTVARDLVHPDDLDHAIRLRSAVHQGDEPDDVDVRFRTSAGHYRACSVRARRILDADGIVTGIVLVLRDVHRQTAVLRALATLSRVNEAMVRATDEDELLAAVCAAVVETGGYPLVWFGRPQHDPDRTIAPCAAAGPAVGYLDGRRLLVGGGRAGSRTDGAGGAHRIHPGARRHRLRSRLRTLAHGRGRLRVHLQGRAPRPGRRRRRGRARGVRRGAGVVRRPRPVASRGPRRRPRLRPDAPARGGPAAGRRPRGRARRPAAARDAGLAARSVRPARVRP